jgi:uncharacterized protein YfdQ (DUF2303 family)
VSTPETIAAAIAAGKNLTQVHQIANHKTVATVPCDLKVVEIPRDKLESPRFLTAAPKFHDPAAFIKYVNDFKAPETRIFHTDEGVFVAVLDYHRISLGAEHGDHTATLELRRSPEWKEWAGASGKPFGQQAFAEFIEDNARDITNPDPETMLRIASGLHATVGAEFRQATNQANGQIQLSYNETINGTVNGKDEAIPASFQIGLRPFLGGPRYAVDCRLRYRIERSSGAALKLHFKALHLDVHTETALEQIVAKVKDETLIVPALGSHDAEAFKRGM